MLSQSRRLPWQAVEGDVENLEIVQHSLPIWSMLCSKSRGSCCDLCCARPCFLVCWPATGAQAA